MNIVCVINDQPAHLALTMVHLLRLGCGVVACKCASALELLEQVDPHLIIVEIELPGDRELSLIPQLRSQIGRSDTPILVLSPTINSLLADSVFEAGADGLYQHPKDISQLATLLTQYLGLGTVPDPLP
jgi:CheY-like chemotaxis protein